MEIDITSWEKDSQFTTGSREKKWMIDPLGTKWLFKEPKTEGERIAEVVAYHVGVNLFDLKMADTRFAVYQENKGVISKNFLKLNNQDYILQESIDFFGPEFDATDLLMYRLEDAIEICKKYNSLEEFIKMGIFDYLIANQDRHCENWGFISSVENQSKKQFAPLYDNGSSLMCGYTEEQISDYLLDFNRLNAYNNRSKSMFTISGKKKSKSAVFIKELMSVDSEMFRRIFSGFRCQNYDNIEKSIKELDEEKQFISNNRCQLISLVIASRLDVLEKWLKEGEEKC